MKIGIIGFGAAGISVLRELVRQKEKLQDHTILVFSNEKLFATGLPYQEDDEVLVLNQFAETMSMYPEDTLHFVNWVKKNKSVADPLGKHLPRAWYGQYLKELANILLEKSQAVVIKQEVTSIRVTEEGRYLVKTDELEKTCDIIHLATGHLAYQDPYELNGIENYIHHPYPVISKLKNISEKKHVGILGTGLTAVDLMLYLKKITPHITISFVSPDGKFGSVRGIEENKDLEYFTKENIKAEKEKNQGLISLLTIKEWFVKEAEYQGIDSSVYWRKFGQGAVDDLRFDLKHLQEIGDFQSIIHSMTTVYSDIWNAMSEEDRQNFLNHFSEDFTRFRSPLPSKTIEQLLKYIDNSSVSIYSGISSVRKNNTKFEINFDSRDGICVDYLLNGTGQTKDLEDTREAQSRLIQQLINEHILQAYTYGGVQILYSSMSVLSQRYGLLKNFKVYGQLVSGIDYFNNTVELISKSAVRGVESTLEWMRTQQE